MEREISKHELRNESEEIIRVSNAGVVHVTRGGIPIGPCDCEIVVHWGLGRTDSGTSAADGERM